MVRVGVIRFPGSNCEEETLRAAARAGAEGFEIWHGDTDLQGADVVILPGGFSYGDYLRSGAIARFSPVMAAVGRHASAGGGVVGICNGFQILCEAGLLPGALMRNEDLHFVSRPVDVRVERTDTLVTRAYQDGAVIRIPVGHGEGRYVAPPETLARLEAEHQVVLRYVGGGSLDAPANPNGAMHDIAGICNPAGTVIGMMPHPERLADPALGSDIGLGFFRSLVTSLASTA
ncbi:MAG TPA: phosphoribosylformylglycinamidine synthase subunit PurQ [Gemmatimonadales bacterium]|nr:phosphoribosylformylglycinamidine synthase subunit PurQ [Gemmatimonadales bacterium]